MDLRPCISNKFLGDTDASAAGPRTTLATPLLQVIVGTRNDACQELPCYAMHKWTLLLLLSCLAISGSLLLKFHCPPPACTHPVCQPQPTTHCSLNFLCSFCPWGFYACSCLSSKNVLVLPPTHTTVLLWKNFLLFEAQLKCPGSFCISSPVGINQSFAITLRPSVHLLIHFIIIY